jgi:RNA polymerase sigma factor (sigma-70 family)
VNDEQQKLFDENQNLAYYIAHKWSRRNGLDIDDCRQVALIALWRAAQTYVAGDTRFAVYASILIERKLMYEADKQTRYKKYLAAAAELCTDEAPTPPDIDFDSFNKAIAVLNDRQRYIIDARYRHGLTYRAIAKTLGVSHQAVQISAEKALAKMRRRLGVLDDNR